MMTAAVLVHTFKDFDWRATFHVPGRVGVGAMAGLLPFGIGLLFDASGVMLVAGGAGIELRAATTLAVRVASEAFHFGAPGGVVASEAAGLTLLKTRCGLSTPEGVVVLGGRKQLVMRAHAAYLLLCACCGAAGLSAMRAHAPWLVAASALVPLACSVALGVGMRRAPGLARLAGAAQTTALATAAFLASWLLEAVETAVILRVAGIWIPVSYVFAVEGALSLARSAVAFVPGGFGVQDAGYATLLSMVGVPPERAAAFVVLKRAKEIAWIAVGACVIMSSRQPAELRTCRAGGLREVGRGGTR